MSRKKNEARIPGSDRAARVQATAVQLFLAVSGPTDIDRRLLRSAITTAIDVTDMVDEILNAPPPAVTEGQDEPAVDVETA